MPPLPYPPPGSGSFAAASGLLLPLLEAAHEATNAAAADAAAPPPPSPLSAARALVSICLAARWGLKHWAVATLQSDSQELSPGEGLSARLVGAGLALLDTLLCEWQPVIAPALGGEGEGPAATQVERWGAELRAQLVALQQELDVRMQEGRAGAAAPLPFAAVVRCKCRISLLLGSCTQPSSAPGPAGTLPTSSNMPMAHCQLWQAAGVKGEQQGAPGQQPGLTSGRLASISVGLLAPSSPAAGEEGAVGTEAWSASAGWLHAPSVSVPLRSQQQQQQQLLHSCSRHQACWEPWGTAALGAGEGVTAAAALGSSPSALPTDAAGAWEQRLLGWVCALLTPGLPCCLHLQLHTELKQAIGAACYSPAALATALCELAAGVHAETEACSGAPSEAVLCTMQLCGEAVRGVLVSMAASAFAYVTDPQQQQAAQKAVCASAAVVR